MFDIDSSSACQLLSRQLPKPLLIIGSEPISMSAVLSILTFFSIAPAQGQEKNPHNSRGSKHFHLNFEDISPSKPPYLCCHSIKPHNLNLSNHPLPKSLPPLKMSPISLSALITQVYADAATLNIHTRTNDDRSTDTELLHQSPIESLYNQVYTLREIHSGPCAHEPVR